MIIYVNMLSFVEKGLGTLYTTMITTMYYSICQNSSALLHALPWLTACMGRGSSFTKMRICQSALFAFASVCTLVSLALSMKCRRFVAGIVAMIRMVDTCLVILDS